MGVNRLQPADRQQQPHHQHGARHRIAQPHKLHRQLGGQARRPAQVEGQQQRQRHGQQGADAGQPEAVDGPANKRAPRQAMAIGQQWPQHEEHRQHKAQQHRRAAHQPGQPDPGRAQTQGPGVQRVAAPAAGLTKAQPALGSPLQAQQQGDQKQEQGSELGRRDPVVHGQPSLVDTSAEGLDAKVTGYAKVSQGFHQGQSHAGRHGRSGQRKGHSQDAPAQGCAQQASGLHQIGTALTQGRTGQQVNIRVKGEGEHPGRTAQAAHLGENPALQAQVQTQKILQRPAVLKKISVGIGHHIGRHGQGQQQGPGQQPSAGELKQGHGYGSTQAKQAYPRCDQQAQPQGGQGIVRQYRAAHLEQDLSRLGAAVAPRQPSGEHTQNRQHEQQGQKQEQGLPEPSRKVMRHKRQGQAVLQMRIIIN